MAKARGIPPLGRTPNALPAPQAPAYLPMAKARGITQDLVTFRAIEDAYHTHTVLVFRQQHLQPEHVLHFARRPGPIEMSPRTQFALPGYPEILLLSNILDTQGRPIGNADAG